MTDYKTIAESNNFIVLEYTKESRLNDGYQSEGSLEREFIQDLQKAPFVLVWEKKLAQTLLSQPHSFGSA